MFIRHKLVFTCVKRAQQVKDVRFSLLLKQVRTTADSTKSGSKALLMAVDC